MMTKDMTVFSSYFSKQPTPMKLGDVVRMIATDATLQSNTEAYRASKDKAFKMRCPLFAPACNFEGGKALEHITQLTGLSLVDFDHIPARQLAEVRRKAEADPHTLLCYTTVSGQGVRVIFGYDMPEDLSPAQQRCYYTKAFRAGNDYYSLLTGQDADPQCKNIGRLSGLAYDPTVYYAPEATAFSQDWLTARIAERKEQQKGTARRAAELRKIKTIYQTLLAPELEKEEKVYQEGSRNEYVSCLAYKLNELGFSMEGAVRFVGEEFPDCENVEGVVKSCYRDTERHGTRHLPRKNAGGNNYATVDDIEHFLSEHVRLRFNEITQRVEYSLKQEDGKANDFQPMTNRTCNSLYREISRTQNVNKRMFENIIESDFAESFNPFTSYFSQLPEWQENDTDYIQLLAKTVTVKGDKEQQRLWLRFLKKWLVGMVAGWTDSQVVNNVILVLIGEQGIYKTSWISHLLPPQLQRYFYTKTNANRLSKDDMLVLSMYGLVVYEELDTMQREELNQLKAAVTMAVINERPAYGHFIEDYRHIASFAATGNNPQFLSDPTGNRRWLPFEVEEIQSPWEHELPYEGIYSQAIYLYKHGFQYWFSKEEIIEQNKHNSDFEAPKLEHELVTICFEHPREENAGQFMPAAQILKYISDNISAKLTATALGRAMSDLGYQRIKRYGIRGYIVVPRTSEEIHNLQKRLALPL